MSGGHVGAIRTPSWAGLKQGDKPFARFALGGGVRVPAFQGAGSGRRAVSGPGRFRRAGAPGKTAFHPILRGPGVWRVVRPRGAFRRFILGDPA